MERGLYIAASGMLAEMVRQEQIANDLANAATPGYKADHAAQRSFASLLLSDSRGGGVVGSLGLGAEIDEVRTDLSPAPIHATGEPLDLAIEGEGFFAVRTAAGIRYTRDGQFAVSARGTLTDQLGHEVIASGGGAVRVRPDGTVAAAEVGVFAVKGARKVGDALFAGNSPQPGSGQVRTRALEESATDPARSTVEMIASMRALEASQKAIQTIDQTLGDAAGQLGALN